MQGNYYLMKLSTGPKPRVGELSGPSTSEWNNQKLLSRVNNGPTIFLCLGFDPSKANKKTTSWELWAKAVFEDKDHEVNWPNSKHPRDHHVLTRTRHQLVWTRHLRKGVEPSAT
mmetsp:Transcript_96492/g.201625  ORF Transcript_96492/g.201625 Transcript_96492/m.201625 type:complete len:114 (+) Transcript_96492:1852-2193(+)